MKEDNEMRLIKSLIDRGREIDFLKTKLVLYEAFLTPSQKKSADAYAEELKRGREDK